MLRLCLGVVDVMVISNVSFVPKCTSRRRLMFNTKFFMKESKVHQRHSHGKAATIRTGANWTIDQYIERTGGVPYTISMSMRDKTDGQRPYYHIRDFVMSARDDPLIDSHIFKMVDIDYYADMEYWLSFGKPLVIYTFVPTIAGGKTVNASFHIENDRIVMPVNGGGHYSHMVWDYEHDFVTVYIIAGVWIISIDQKYCNGDPMRRIIQLTP